MSTGTAEEKSVALLRHEPRSGPEWVFPRASAVVALAVAVLSSATWGPGLSAQEAVPRIMMQDPALNHLVDPPGYTTGALGELGRIVKSGTGDALLILIPGLGFGGNAFGPLARRFEEDYTVVSVTLPGFDGTPAPPSPPADVSFGDQVWTNGALTALTRLIDESDREEVIVVGHWLTGTQLAVRLARARPGRVRGVVLLAGAAKLVFTDPSAPAPSTLAERIAGVDDFMAPRWFKTVTRETWDDNNFLPGDYAAHPVLGLRLWRQAARPSLHVWVRYLNEFYAQDVLLELPHVEAPILLLRPGFEGAYTPPGNDYLRAYTRTSWEGRQPSGATMTVHDVPGSRIVMWTDQLDVVEQEIRDFLPERAGSR